MYLLFDIGGTNMRIAVSSDGKTIGHAKTVPTPKDFEEGLNTIKQVADELASGQRIEAVAGGVAGPLDKDKTMLVSSPHVGGWVNRPLKTELEKLFNCSVHLENDAALAGLGEAAHGAGVNHKIVAYLTISTGVGGGRVVNKKIDENSLGFEPGHQIIVVDGQPCNCGGKGHLEAYVGGLYLQKKYGQKGEDIKDPNIWDQVAKYLAIGLNNVTTLWSPDIIVLGGALTQSIPFEKVKKYLQEFSTILPQIPEIKIATLGHEAGLHGALAYLNQQPT